ncbi:MAG: hypothetical protein JRJ43_10450 [Deltaproteobacteria bacterium]|nr:hypothetical protein [Deltaproteobacteria bacterium]
MKIITITGNIFDYCPLFRGIIAALDEVSAAILGGVAAENASITCRKIAWHNFDEPIDIIRCNLPQKAAKLCGQVY